MLVGQNNSWASQAMRLQRKGREISWAKVPSPMLQPDRLTDGYPFAFFSDNLLTISINIK
jgi:hypothetical protein